MDAQQLVALLLTPLFFYVRLCWCNVARAGAHEPTEQREGEREREMDGGQMCGGIAE